MKNIFTKYIFIVSLKYYYVLKGAFAEISIIHAIALISNFKKIPGSIILYMNVVDGNEDFICLW